MEVILQNGSRAYACKIDGARDGNNPERGGCVAYHMVKEQGAFRVQGDDGKTWIQLDSGTATHIDTQDGYEEVAKEKGYEPGTRFDIKDHDVNVYAQAKEQSLIQGAIIMDREFSKNQTQDTTMDRLFAKLRSREISVADFRIGICALIDRESVKDGATKNDIQALHVKFDQEVFEYQAEEAESARLERDKQARKEELDNAVSIFKNIVENVALL